MTFRTRAAAMAALALVLAASAACGGDDDTGQQQTVESPSPSVSTTGTASATTTASATVTASASPSATGTVSRGVVLARSPQYFVYEASEGDTVQKVADAFDATPDGPSADFVAQIRSDNQLTGDDLEAGQLLGIRLVLPGDLALIPDASMQEALGSSEGGPVLLQPSLEMRSGFMGKLVLHRVKLDLPDSDGGPAGYVMEYWLADRPPIKGGVVDPDAMVSDLQFTLAGGTLANTLQGSASELHTWERDGTKLALKAAISRPSPAQLADMLETAAER